MTLAITAAPILLPPCARLAAVCAAIEGKEVTCPVAMQRACPTLAAIRRMAGPAEGRPDT
ncbi:hypothetical protein [Amaricoccus sp.]|uniref:hypothetical protein n=1 Tax=Amaricoccus sp. TaxID=1872485 RepID=UPI00262859B8|nr:hypothetical protein [Amaricoccus sp.]HRO09921.1 hypothetical protein [Amaricoccus sp.]